MIAKCSSMSHTASWNKVGTVLEWALFIDSVCFTIKRKIYALGRFYGSLFKLPNKRTAKISPRFCNNKTVPTLRQCPLWVVEQKCANKVSPHTDYQRLHTIQFVLQHPLKILKQKGFCLCSPLSWYKGMLCGYGFCRNKNWILQLLLLYLGNQKSLL